MNRLHDQIQKTVIRELTNVHTTIIARVTKVNRAEGTIACQPVVNRIVNGESVPLPEFPDVPVITLQGGKHYISFPIREDDYCLLFVSERCFDKWYEGSDNEDPSDTRMFDYSDCFALVGVNPRAKVMPISEDNEIFITTETGEYIRIVENDRFEVYGINSKIDLTGNSDITIEGDNTVSITGNSDTTIKGDGSVNVTGNVTVNITGNADIKVTGNVTAKCAALTATALSAATLTSPATVLTGGTVKIGGAVAPSGSGALCGIPFCLFTGAPQTGEISSGT